MFRFSCRSQSFAAEGAIGIAQSANKGKDHLELFLMVLKRCAKIISKLMDLSC